MTIEITNCNALQLTERWYSQLVEDCKDIVTEAEFSSRWDLVEGYHQLGSRILTEYENFQRIRMADNELVQRVAISIGRSDRTVYYAIQFARAYPDLNLLPEAKNTNWHRIVNKYLTNGKEKPAKESPTEMIKQIKQLLQTEWLKENQLVVSGEVAINKSNCEFIRYLQDQVEKITGRSLS